MIKVFFNARKGGKAGIYDHSYGNYYVCFVSENRRTYFWSRISILLAVSVIGFVFDIMPVLLLVFILLIARRTV